MMLDRSIDEPFSEEELEQLAPIGPMMHEGFGTTRARTQKRLNLARLHVQDELLRAGVANDTGTQALFAGRGILEHYLK